MFPHERRHLFGLALPEQGRGTDSPDADGALGCDNDPDRLGKSGGFLEPRLARTARLLTRHLRHHDHRALTTSDVVHAIILVLVQDSSSASRPPPRSDAVHAIILVLVQDSSSASPPRSGSRSSGCAG